MRRGYQAWTSIAVFGVLWVDLIRELSFQWSASDQYAYGWFVPWLGAGLFWRRWMSRPSSEPGRSPAGVRMLVGLLAMALLPIRVVYEINPDWPLPAWLEAVAVVGLTLYGLFRMGGGVWVRHFAFSVCFILLAVRWPYRIEHWLTNGLMESAAWLTVELLWWMGVIVDQHGNVMAVTPGAGAEIRVGIDEACSGIRSFQATLMGALFMGELYRMRWRWRAGFLFGGIMLAYAFNVIRTSALTWSASIHGLTVLDRWHDLAGLSIFLLSFVCLWGAAGWVSRRAAEPITRRSKASGTGQGGGGYGVLPQRYLVKTGCWMIVVLGLTELWYRSHDSRPAGEYHWTVRLPEQEASFESIPLPPRTVRLLAYDLGKTGRWREEDGRQWTVNFFRWKPRSVESVIHARMHRPEICLPATGFQAVSESKPVRLRVGELELPFLKCTYQNEARERLHVFFCLWEDGAEKQAGIHVTKGGDRIQSVMTGRRRLGQQSLELIATGYANLDLAEQRLRRLLPELIQAEQPE